MSRGVDAATTRDLLEVKVRRKRKAVVLREWKGAALAKQQKGVALAPLQKGAAAALHKGRGAAIMVEQEGTPNLPSDSGRRYCVLSIPIVLQRPQPHWCPNLHRLAEWSFLEPRNWW
ncbi:hypothetical protein SETIT_2G101100v2 [Setaria italica]|uniref:Uncharacterized protein n=1 Tax=Setaria italica TaxID=4555 RepID=A0A368PX41_SETIT|nr:hypothetical protein SETIT_2G101100v2 [Setaria italica]